jgi:HEAT repeat protein
MEPGSLVLIFIVSIFLVGSRLTQWQEERRHYNAWRVPLEAEGLIVEAVGSQLRTPLALVGRTGALRLRLEFHSNNSRTPVRIIVHGVDPPLADVVVCRRSGSVDGVRLGDDGFDESLAVDGPPALVRALFDLRMRQALIALDRHVISFSIGPRGGLGLSGGGELRVEIVEREGRAPLFQVSEFESRQRGIHLVLEVARRLPGGLTPAEIAERLSENARHDPVTAVRVKNLEALARAFHGRPSTHEALVEACADARPEVRLHAAQALGEERLDVLFALAEDPAVDDTCAAGAVYALGAHVDTARALRVLERAVRARRFGTAHGCLERLGECGEAAVAGLAQVLAHEDGELGAHAARALARTAAPGAEGPLVAALARDAGTRLAAAEALGACGTPAAVLPLREAEERHAEPDFRRAARQAIGAIQARLDGVSPGQLSLAAAGTGQVSLAETEAGQLSFPAQDGGAVSLADDKDTRGA